VVTGTDMSSRQWVCEVECHQRYRKAYTTRQHGWMHAVWR